MPDEIISEEIFLKWVASVENFSQHPIAKSIVYQSEIREITLLSAQDVKEQSGVGIEGVVEGQHIKIQNNVASKESSLKVTINEKVYIIYLEEESSVSTNFLNELKLEKEIIILSGDKEINVKKFADNHNVDEYHFGKNPEEKLEFIKNKQESNQVIFIGDGINDSPSIKQADVGVTTSSSSQIAQVSGDILIHKGGLETINKIFKLSQTMYSFVPIYPSGIWSWTFASEEELNLSKLNYKEVIRIEKGCDVWNLNFQNAAFKMMPNKIVKELNF